MYEGFLVIRSGGHESHNRHQFRPNNYFYYLTGYDTPEVFLILSPGDKFPFMLTVPQRSLRQMIYDGAVLTGEEIKSLYGPDRVIHLGEFYSILDSIFGTGEPVYMDRGDREFGYWLERSLENQEGTELRDVSELVDELRVIKDPLEVARLQKACNITSRALTRVMAACEPEMYEFELEAIIEGTFLEFGASMPGFPSIVGAGANSTTLHYEPNNRLMEAGDLLLMDIGAEYGYYTADITRTIPVNGKFSREQREIYQLVLEGQKAAIERLVNGARITDGSKAVKEIVLPGLFELGLVTDTTAAWQYRFYTIHGISHWLGLYVHDVGDYGYSVHEPAPDGTVDSRILEPGMVFTIEPGVYIRENGLEQLQDIFGSRVDSVELEQFITDVKPVYDRYINIGVRIEDDLLITEEGNLVLSRYAPKEIRDIEQLMR